MSYSPQFITLEIQRGKSKPAKYKHYLKIPMVLYYELDADRIIIPESYYVNQDVFFEFNLAYATLNFVSYYLIEDLQRKIDYYLINKITGGYPLIRGINC